MDNIKLCQEYGKALTKIQIYQKRKRCSAECYHKSRKGSIPWNLGKTGYVTENGRNAMAENGRRNLLKQTPKQVAERIKKTIKNREGNWTPPMTGKKGEKCPNWMGEQAGYNGKHKWVQKNWKKTGVCQECGKIPISKGRNKYATQWSNNDHKYRRIREEWQELCPKCHRKKDNQII